MILGIRMTGTSPAGKVKNMSTRMKNMALTHAKITVEVEKWINKNFKQDGKLAHEGRRWKPLTQGTINARRSGKNKDATKAQILRDTGALRRNWKAKYDDRQALLESGVNYGRKHHHGSSRRNIPQRRILPTGEQITPTVRKIYKRKLEVAMG